MSLAFCGRCGAGLERRPVSGRPRDVCPECGWINYEQLKVGAAALVVRDARVLLVRRGTEPFVGRWSLPAGYVENDETPGAAARRETREEVGIDVAIGGLTGVYFFDDDPRGNGILIVYECSAEAGKPRSSAEVTEAAYFAPDTVPAELAGAGHDQAIRDWASRSLRGHS